jgi:hypothetical protein
MTDEQLRMIVRESIARHLGRQGQSPRLPAPQPLAPSWQSHASHARFILVTGLDTDGPCLIEPAVGCSHCGFCQSMGH